MRQASSAIDYRTYLQKGNTVFFGKRFLFFRCGFQRIAFQNESGYNAREVSVMLRGSVKQKLLLMISVLILISVSAATILSDRSYRNDLIAQSTQSTRQLLEQLSINLVPILTNCSVSAFLPIITSECGAAGKHAHNRGGKAEQTADHRRLSGRSNDPSAKRHPPGVYFQQRRLFQQ